MSVNLDVTQSRREMAESVERDQEATRRRAVLRDAVPLPQVERPRDIGPAFVIGWAENYVGPRLPDAKPDSGHMSKEAQEEFIRSLEKAGHQHRAGDLAGRDSTLNDAAGRIQGAMDQRKQDARHALGLDKDGALHQGRQFVVAEIRELAMEKAGLDPLTATAVGHGLERALERRGAVAVFNMAVDGLGHFSTAIAGKAADMAHAHGLETKLQQSLGHLAERGVSGAALKEMVSHHAGKIQALATAVEHSEGLGKAARFVLAHDNLMTGLYAASKDSEVRKAVGDVTLALGETATATKVGAGLGSVGIMAGSFLRGDSMEDTGRHAFRAAMTIAGGAAGAAAGALTTFGIGGVAGGMVGSTAGSLVADKVLEVYDKYFPEASRNQAPQQRVSDEQYRASLNTLGQKATHSDFGKDMKSAAGREVDRELRGALGDQGAAMARGAAQNDVVKDAAMDHAGRKATAGIDKLAQAQFGDRGHEMVRELTRKATG